MSHHRLVSKTTFVSDDIARAYVSAGHDYLHYADGDVTLPFDFNISQIMKQIP